MTRNIERHAVFALLVLYAASLVILSYREGLTAYSKLLGVIIIGVFGATIIRRTNRPIFPIELVALFVWLLWSVMSSMFANDVDIAYAKLITLFQVLLLSVVLCSVFVWQKSVMPFWIAFAVVAVVSSVMTLSNPESFVDRSGRVSGTVGNANLFGFVLTIGVITSLAGSLAIKQWLAKLLLLVTSMFLFYMIAETGSRKAMIASIVAIFVVFLVFSIHLWRRGGPKFVAFVLVSLLFLSSGLYFLASSEHFDRLEGAVTAAERGNAAAGDGSLDKRAYYIKTAYEHALRNPIMGIGLDNFRTIRNDLGTSSIGSYSHSNYMEVMVSTGIPGLILYVTMYIVMIIKIIAMRSRIASEELVGAYAIGAAVVLTVVAFDFAMVSYYEKLPWLVIAAAIAQVQLLKQGPHMQSG